MEALPAAIGAGGSIISGIFGSNAASQQQASIRRGQDIQKELALLAREDLAPDRKFHGNALEYLSNVMGLQNNGQGSDPYTDPNLVSYLKMAQPYIEALQPVTNKVGGIADMFGAAPGADGQPAWYSNALAGFKGSPDYKFARDEALRTGLQAAGTGGNIAGGGRVMAAENRAAGLASQNFNSFRDSVINSILSGGKMALGGYEEQANMLGKGLSWGTSAQQADDTRYNNFFNRLLQASGLGSSNVAASAKIAADTGTNLANLNVLEGSAASKGTNALGTGIAGAAAQFSNPNSAMWQSWGSSSGSGSGNSSSSNYGDYYGGGGDYGTNPYGAATSTGGDYFGTGAI